MGCGAICGDTSHIQTATFHSSQRAMQHLLPLLNKNSHLAHTQTYRHFAQHYYRDVPAFHLTPKPKLVKDEQVTPEIKTKWKLILYGLHSDHHHYCNCLGLEDVKKQLSSLEEVSARSQPHELLEHAEFKQIEKDISRTLPMPQDRKKEFQNVLKRITNFFPKMGYTQGLNFIVGYLILVGYSESDSFWMFVHIAINRRYLLLGLFEEKFPLSSVLDRLFRNVLKREDAALFHHIFDNLQIEPALWTFKWFTTCFLYSFPIQMIKYVWDLLIQVGCFAIVTFAVSLTKQLAPHLIRIVDMADFCQFVSSLSNIECFNEHVNMQIVMNQSYLLQIIPQDFEGNHQMGDFYQQYLKTKILFKEQNAHKTIDQPPSDQSQRLINKKQQLLQHFYNTLLQQRKQLKTGTVSSMPLPINTVIKHFLKVQQSNEQLNTLQLTQKDVWANNLQAEVIKKDATKEQNTAQTFRPYSPHKINQIEEGPNDVQEVALKISHRQKQPQFDEMDELDKFQKQYSKNNSVNLKINNFSVAKPSESQGRLKQFKKIDSNHTNKSKPQTTKPSNIRVLHGQNLLKIQSCDAVSVSSRHTNTNRSANNKKAQIQEPKSVRICGCKTKTEENNCSSIGLKSENEESKDRLSDKDSLSNKQYSHNGDFVQDNISFQNQEHERKANDYMVSSHGPTIKQKQGDLDLRKIENENEVEMLPPFKKDKRHKKYRVFEVTSGDNKQKLFTAACDRQNSVESILPAFNQLISHEHIVQGIVADINRCEIQSIR